MEETPVHIAMVPSPGMGLLIPFVEFAKQLVYLHGFHITCIIPTVLGPSPDAMKSVLASLPACVHQIFLPVVSFEDIPEGPDRTAAIIHLAVTRSLSHIRDVLNSFTAATRRFHALFVDLFGVSAFDVAKELNISPCLFFSSGAMPLSYFLYLPKLDQMVSCDFRDLAEPVQCPGCIPIPGKDFLEPVQDRTSHAYRVFLENTKRFGLAKAIAVNSFIDLEPAAIKALQEAQPGSGKPLVYPVGPLVQDGSRTPSDGGSGSGSHCLQWLDEQPRGSVLFVSFGSGGTLSHAQQNELALGLEMSGQRFLWVVRCPNDQSPSAAYLGDKSSGDPFDSLPEGFFDRIKGRGLLVPSWAPQAKILSHGSVGGFLTHCGWSSILESVVNGVPLVAWPLFAEQKMNALMLTEEIKVAVRPKVGENGLVRRDEVAKVVRSVMVDEGKRIRERMEDLKDAAAKALEEGGSSWKALSELAHELKNQENN